MDNSNISPNWFRLHQAIQDLTILQQLSDNHQQNHINLMRQKISQCRDLKVKLQQDEGDLKKEYLALMAQKSLYAGQLQNLYQLGNKLNWEPQVLRRIRPLIDSTKQRIQEKKGRGDG